MKNRSLCLLGGIKLSNKELVKKGIPFLSQLPVLGYIFGTVSSNREEREMIIGIYPNVIESKGAANVGSTILKRIELMEDMENDSKDKGKGTECGKEGDK
jgi:type II secretory pathway component GspD/PulD (secretin)